MATSPLDNSSGALLVSLVSEGTEVAGRMEIVAIDIVSAVNRITTATITLADGDMPNLEFPLSDSATFAPGSAITVKAGYGDSDSEIFSGVVIKHSIKISGENDARLVIECRDKALAMTVGRKNGNYIDKKDSDIITQLIGNYGGLTADVTATTNQHKELVQYYCSDWDFMLARAEANGMLVTLDAGKVIVKAPDVSPEPTLTVTYGVDIIDFNAELDARTQYQAVQSTAWDLTNLAITQQQAQPETLTSQGNITSATLAQVLGLATFGLQSSVPLDSGNLTSWSKAQQLKSALARIRGYVSFQGNALIKTGQLLELKGVGERFNGKVFVSGVNHQIREGDWHTTVDFGMSPNWFTETNDIVAPLASGLTAGVSGLYTGIVKKLDADPESQYKIQVSIPVLQAQTDGFWARLAQFYGSSTFGSFFIPEIGDEVILGFFNDDPSHPVILGSLYSSKNKPAYELTAENNTKAIITRSKMKLTFDDDKKIITLVTPGNNTIVISDQDKSILLQDQNNNKVELNSSGITLDSPKDISITAKGKISLDATGNVEITSKADVKATGLNVTCTANIGFTAKGSATAEVSASGTTTIKGAMVMIN
jgi:Rhs element Vgr protein